MWFVLILLLSAQAGEPAKKVAGKDASWLSKRLVKADDALLRAAIVREMGLQRNPALLGQLVRAVDDRDSRVRSEALLGLGAYGGALDDEPRDRAYLQGLIDPSQQVREAALQGAAARYQAGASPTFLTTKLLAMARQSRAWQARLLAVQILEYASEPQPQSPQIDPVLIEVLRAEANAEVRRAAAIAVGNRGLVAAAEQLHHLRSRDPDAQVRIAAETALSQLGVKATELVVAVMPFETRVAKVREFTAGLQDAFSSTLAASQVVTVVERRQISATLKELVFQDTHIDDGKAVTIGKLLRAQEVVTGSTQLRGSTVSCLAKRVDVTSGEITGSVTVTGQLHDLDALQQRCASRLLSSF